jgi:hypothetical protein
VDGRTAQAIFTRKRRESIRRLASAQNQEEDNEGHG